MATERRRGPGLAAVALGIGMVLVALPWLPRPQENPLPRHFAADSDAVALLLESVQRVDASCRRGDLAAFGAAVTPAYAEGLARQLRQLDRELDRSALRDSTTGERHGGILAALEPLAGLGGERRGDVAVLAFDYQGAAAAVFDGFKLLRFCWDGVCYRLDQVRDARRRPGVARERMLQALVETMLER